MMLGTSAWQRSIEAGVAGVAWSRWFGRRAAPGSFGLEADREPRPGIAGGWRRPGLGRAAAQPGVADLGLAAACPGERKARTEPSRGRWDSAQSEARGEKQKTLMTPLYT